jgi:beta-lactamase class A
MLIPVLSLLLVCTIVRPAAGQDPLEDRARHIQNLFSADPKGFDTVFSDYFLSQIPPTQLTQIFTQFYSQYGKVTEFQRDTLQGPLAAKYGYVFEKGYRVPVSISLNAKAPHLIEGLWLGQPTKLATSLADVVNQLKQLKGVTSLHVSKGGQPIIAHNADRWLAIGSAFKLYVLKALMEDIARGKRLWSDVVELRERSLPSGVMQRWPVGSPVTLHTLALMMISISDNTATDQLMEVLGHAAIEAPFYLSSHSEARRNIPFLKTDDMFKLKALDELRRRYLAGDTDERRALLSSDTQTITLENFPSMDRPLFIDTLEWFASAEVLSSLMMQLRDLASSNKEAAKGLEILSINPGLAFSEKKWETIAYKGGSEMGVLNLTFLLKSRAGEWYTLVATWNDPQAPLREDEFFALVQRTIELL